MRCMRAAAQDQAVSHKTVILAFSIKHLTHLSSPTYVLFFLKHVQITLQNGHPWNLQGSKSRHTTEGPFKCYVTLFSRKLDPTHPSYR